MTYAPGIARRKAALFRDHFPDTSHIQDADLQAYWASGRLNLIGEHTDYNQGYVLPAAVQLMTAVVGRAIQETSVQLWSELEQQQIRIETASLPESFAEQQSQLPHWAHYALAVCAGLRDAGLPTSGFQAIIHGNVPAGAGLSSSAALEVALARAYLGFAGLTNIPQLDDPFWLPALCQRAEQRATGLQSGILDQTAACLIREESLLFLDCQTHAHRFLPWRPGDDAVLLVVHSGVRRALAHTGYNQRVRECQQAVELFQQARELEQPGSPSIRSLRDVTVAEFDRWAARLPELPRKRAGYILAENARVLRAAELLEQLSGEVLTTHIGELLWQSHAGQRDEYEVSCPEIDLLVRIASETPGVAGARLMGGGFGGCIIALLKRSAVREFRDRIVREYPASTGFTPAFHAVRFLRRDEVFTFRNGI